jgi:hypothetical protein
LKTNVFQHVRLKFRQHVNVASPRIEIMAQHRTEQAQFADAAFLAETRDLLALI